MGAPEWTTACPDWAARLINRKSIIPPPIYPDMAAYARRIVHFVDGLVASDEQKEHS